MNVVVDMRERPLGQPPVACAAVTAQSFWVETLGCPKNAVDSDKVVASLLADGLVVADDAAAADLVVVNTCAFVEAARQESIDTVLALGDVRKSGSRLVVTGCMAERYGDELAARAARGRRGGRVRGRGRALGDGGRSRSACPWSSPSACATCSSCPAPRRACRGRT